MTEERSIKELKELADSLEIQYHPNIGAEKLASKIQEKMGPQGVQAADIEKLEAAATDEPPAVPAKETETQRRNRIKQKAKALVRIRVTCMNPNKADYEGEILCTGNKVTGSIKRYIPFGVEWHVERMLLNLIKEKQCQVFRTVTHPGTKQKYRKGFQINEFAVEELPALTPEELKDLAQRQAMANGTQEAA